MATRWSTKEKVQADLARASQRISLVEEDCLVYKERLPPMPTADEETEVEQQLRFGASMVNSQQPSPDLQGITNMLKMIRNNDNSDTTQNLPTNEVIIISKLTPHSPKSDPVKHTQLTALLSSNLNPNVKEFVPKFTTSQTKCKLKDNNTSDESGTNNDVASVGKENENKEQGAVDSMTEEQRKEREELVIVLKNIIQAPTHDCPKRRRERYSAIVGLLRLNSSPSIPAPTTLECFRTHRASPVAKEAPATARRDEPECDVTPDEQEVRTSISKVSAWLHGKRAVHAPPHLGPVSYRRRIPEPVAEPAREDSVEKARAAADVSYVPSEDARALREQYAARAAATTAPPPSIWEDLQRNLCRKDAERALAHGKNS